MVYMSKNEHQNRYTALGARIKFLREQWQQTLDDVCNTLEIDQTTLKEIEAGKQSPSHEMLDMLISHFLLTEDQAQDLRDLAGDTPDFKDSLPLLDDIMSKQVMMLLPVDNRIVYTDSMQATVNDNGVVLQFMQQVNNGQPVPVSKIGMSRQHAERIIEVLQNTLRQHDTGKQQKMLPQPTDDDNSSQH